MSNILSQIDSLSGYIQSTDTSLTFVTSNNLTNYNQLSGIVSTQSSVYNKIYFSADNITSNTNITGLAGNCNGFINLRGNYLGNSNANINGNLNISSNIIGRSNNIISGFSRISGNANISGNLGISGNLITSSNVIFTGNVTVQTSGGNSAINALLTSYGVPTDYAHFVASSYISQTNNTPLTSWQEFTSSGSNAPTYFSTGGYNGGSYVKFDGTNDYMVGPVGNYPWTSSGGQTTFMLMRYDSTPVWPDFKILFGYTVNLTSTSQGSYYFTDFENEWATWLYNSSGTQICERRNHGGLVTGTYYLLTMSHGASGTNNFTTYLNGANIRENTNTGTYTNINGATPYIGGIPGYSNFKNFSISAMAHYNRVLTTAERNSVTSYMLNNINVAPSGGGGGSGTSSLGNLVYADFINRRMGIGMTSNPLQLLDINGTANIVGLLLQNGRYPLVSNTSGLRIDYKLVTGVNNTSTGTISFNFTFTTIPIIILIVDDVSTVSIRYQNATTSQFTWTTSSALSSLGTIRYLAIGT